MDHEQQLTQYDDFAVQHNRAFEAFSTIYAKKNPPPSYPRVDRSDWYIALIVLILVGASVVVSGSRTIPEFGGGLVGWAAFAMLELGIIAFAFLRTKSNANSDTIKSVSRWTNFGLVLAFIVAVGANVHATLTEHGIVLSENINTIITVFLAISAPTLALISGDILAIQFLRARNAKQRADEEYRTALSGWQEGLNRSWASQQKKWGVRVDVSRPQQVSQGQLVDSTVSPGVPESVPGDSNQGQSVDKRDKVRDILDNDPDAWDMSVRELADRAGVSKSLAGRVKKEYQNG